MSGPVIEIAEGLVMDASEAATQTFGPISAKGGGKSYLAGKFVEGLYDAGAPFVVLDPIGNWSALTLGKDGKSPGLSVVVIGGERGDVPLDEATAGAVGELLIERGVSAVIDVSELSKTRRKVYVADLCEAMYRAARKRRSPFMIVFEEAQLFAPQQCQPGEQRMLGAVTDIVRLGRNFGLGSMLVTQRPQSVSKEVLNQVECLFVGQLRGPQERKAIIGWVKEQGLESINVDQLPALSPGEFYCWSPSWLRVFRKVRILPKRTFDGSSTPVLGKAMAPQSKRTTAGIEQAVAALAGLSGGKEPEVEDETPRGIREALDSLGPDESAELAELRGRVSDLEHENGNLWAKTSRLEKALTRAREAVLGALQELDWAEEMAPAREVPEHVIVPPQLPAAAPIPKARPLPRALARREDSNGAASSSANGLDKPERTILGVLVWQKGPIPKARLALLGGYSAKGGGFNNALGRLRKAGRVEGSSELVITPEGRKVAPTAVKPPTGAALLSWWLQHPKVDTPMAALLRTLHEAGKPLAVEELQARAGYTPKTGGVSNALGRLRTLGLVEGARKAPVALVPELRR